MTKATFVDLVLIRANGGVLNDEMPYQRSDVEAYLPAAVNYVLTAEYRVNLQAEGSREITGLFYGYFSEVPVLVDSAMNKRKYLVIPKAVIPMPGNQGIRSLTDGCEGLLYPLPESSIGSIDYYIKMFPSTRYYRVLGKRMYLYNVNPLVEKLNVVLLVDVSELDGGDELPIPAGQEKIAMDVALEFITGIRQMPADTKNDKKPNNA